MDKFERVAIRAELRDAYDTNAESWHRDHRNDDWWVEGAERFVGMLPPGSRVLDAGCGGGTKAKWLSERGLEVVGADFSENLVAIARGEAPKAEFLVADMQALPLGLDGFDGVFAQASLLHLPHAEIPETLWHWRGRMKHGGILHVAVKERRPGQPREERKTESDYGFEYTRFFSYWTLEELRHKTMLAGFLTVWDSAKVSGRVTWLQIVAKSY